jgi:hypothetical protein
MYGKSGSFTRKVDILGKHRMKHQTTFGNSPDRNVYDATHVSGEKGSCSPPPGHYDPP